MWGLLWIEKVIKDMFRDLYTYSTHDLISVVRQFMHDPKSSHLDAVYRILRYLKSCPGKGLLYTRQGSLQVSAIVMLIGPVLWMIDAQLLDIVLLLEVI